MATWDDHDPALLQRYRFRPQADSLVVEIEVEPGGSVPRHIHPSLTERWEVLRGEAVFTVGRRRSTASPGTSLEVPPGMAHAFANETDEPIELRATVTPPMSTEAFLREGARLHREGKVTRRGLPTSWDGLLQAANFVRRYRDTIVLLGFPFPPRALQPAAFAPFAWLAGRRTSRNGLPASRR